MKNFLQKLKNVLTIVVVFIALIFLFPDTFIATIDDDPNLIAETEDGVSQTEGEFLIEAMSSPRQKEGNFEALYEQLKSQAFTRDKVRKISDCSDEEVIWYINAFPEKFNSTVPEFQSQEELNQYFVNLVTTTLEDTINRSTLSCMNKIMLDP